MTGRAMVANYSEIEINPEKIVEFRRRVMLLLEDIELGGGEDGLADEIIDALKQTLGLAPDARGK